MAQQERMIGKMERVGIGFAAGVGCGAAYGLLAGGLDTAVPAGAALGLIGVPAAWSCLRRLTGRPANELAVTASPHDVAAEQPMAAAA